jgi:hypothetical protein
VPGAADPGLPAEETAHLNQPPEPRVVAPSRSPPASRPRPTARVQRPRPEAVQPVQPVVPFFWLGTH